MSWFGFGSTDPVDATIEGLPFVDSLDSANAALGPVIEKVTNDLDSGDDWTNVELDAEEFPEIQLFERPVGDYFAMKARGQIESEGVTIEKLLERYMDLDLDSRRRWDRDILKFDIVEQFSEEVSMSHTCYASGAPMADNVIAYVTTSVNSAIKESPDNVRGVVTFALRLTQNDGGVTFESYTHINPSGSVPSFLINLFKKKPAARIMSWREWDWK